VKVIAFSPGLSNVASNFSVLLVEALVGVVANAVGALSSEVGPVIELFRALENTLPSRFADIRIVLVQYL
jgi:hypothetical protein